MTSRVISDARPRSRLGWLDALRGIAALVVVFDHSLDPSCRSSAGPARWFNTGRYGVMVFFLVSGYIIPASLERRGCVSGHSGSGGVPRVPAVGGGGRRGPGCWGWLGCASCAAADGARARLGGRRGHVTMLQELLDCPTCLLVLWTLSYEMAFYLLVTALYLVGRSCAARRCLWVRGGGRGGGRGAALGAAVAGRGRHAGDRPGGDRAGGLRAGGGAELAPCPARAGAVVLGMVPLGLIALNGRLPAWRAGHPGLMFAGTALYRARASSSAGCGRTS